MANPSSVLAAPKTSGGSNVTTLTATVNATVPAGVPLALCVWATGTSTAFNAGGPITDSAGNVYTQLTPSTESATANATSTVFLCQGSVNTAGLVNGVTTATVTCVAGRPLGFEWIQFPGYSVLDGSSEQSSSNTAQPVTPGGLTIVSGSAVFVFWVTGWVAPTSASGTGFTVSAVMSAVGASASRQAFWAYDLSGSGTVTPSLTMVGGTGTASWAAIGLALRANVAATSTMTASAGLSAGATQVFADTATIAPAASVTAGATDVEFPATTIVPAASVTAGAQDLRPIAATLNPSASVTAGANDLEPTAATLTASASLSGTGADLRAVSATLTATAGLTAGATQIESAAATLTATASLTGGATVLRFASGTLTATATLTAGLTLTEVGAWIATASAFLLAAATVVPPPKPGYLTIVTARGPDMDTATVTGPDLTPTTVPAPSLTPLTIG